MRFLLASGGISNPSIHNALVDLLGKPIAEASALCIPTAAYAHPMAGPRAVWRMLSGRNPVPFCDLGWQSVGVLELTALPSIERDLWVPLVQQTDALLVGGGDALYLCHWMRQSGLADLFPTLHETVYVGQSAGSMVLTPAIGEEFVIWTPPSGDHRTLGLVGFALFPHLDYEGFPENTLAHAAAWAARLPVPAYAIDAQTAPRVVDDTVDVISEGHWKRFTP